MAHRPHPAAHTQGEDNIGLAIALTIAFAVFAPMSESAAKFLSGAVPPTQISAARFAIHILVIGTFVALAVPRTDWRPKPLWPLIVRGLLTTAGTVCIYAGLAVMPMVDAVAIFFIQPLVLTALSSLILGDHVGLFRWLAVIAGMAGALLIIGPNFENVGWSAAFPALAALFHGSAGLMARRWAGIARLPVFQIYTAFVGIIVTTAALAGGWLAEIPELSPQMPTPLEGLLLLAIGIGSMASTMTLTQALRIAPPSVIAPLLYVHILFSSTLGFLIFGHVPSERTIAGAALVISAGMLVWWRETRQAN
ncbi:MAG: DMT family transporter, partial [Rhizobiales bacterium]|nr:DMT family transporter [Hyphomicrobiales bacterium]